MLTLSILFCVIALPALAELTDADLDKIRLIVNDSEKRVKEDINAEIASSEKTIKEYINIKIESVEKQITLLTNVVYGLIALIVAAIAIPQLIMAERKGPLP